MGLITKREVEQAQRADKLSRLNERRERRELRRADALQKKSGAKERRLVNYLTTPGHAKKSRSLPWRL